MKRPDYYGRILVILHRLKEIYPTYNMGRHLCTILDDCGDVWGLSDKTIFEELQKYKKQLETDKPHDEEKEINKIIEDGMHLDRILIEEENIEEENGNYE